MYSAARVEARHKFKIGNLVKSWNGDRDAAGQSGRTIVNEIGIIIHFDIDGDAVVLWQGNLIPEAEYAKYLCHYNDEA